MKRYVCPNGHVDVYPDIMLHTYCGHCFLAWAARHFPFEDITMSTDEPTEPLKPPPVQGGDT